MVADVTKLPVELNSQSSRNVTGAPVDSLVTVPVIRPPGTNVKLIPAAVASAAIVTGVPLDRGLQDAAHGIPS